MKDGRLLPRFDFHLARGVVREAIAEVRVGRTRVRNAADGHGATVTDEAVPVIENEVVLAVRSGQPGRNLILIRLRTGQRVMDSCSGNAVPYGHRSGERARSVEAGSAGLRVTTVQKRGDG